MTEEEKEKPPVLKSAGGFLIFYITKHQLKQLKTNVINDSVIVILYSCRSTETVKEKQENGADCCCRECVQKFQEKKAGKFDSVLRNEGEALEIDAYTAERNKKVMTPGEYSYRRSSKRRYIPKSFRSGR